MARKLRMLINIASAAFLIVGISMLSIATAVVVVTSVLNLSNIIIDGFSDLPRVIYLMLSGIVSLYGYIELGDVLDKIENGRFEGIRESLLIWGFLGLVFGLVIPGTILLITLFKYYTTFIKVITSV